MQTNATPLQIIPDETMVFLDPHHHTLDKAVLVLGRHARRPSQFILEINGERILKDQTEVVYPVTNLLLS